MAVTDTPTPTLTAAPTQREETRDRPVVSRVVIGLSALVGLLALVATVAGLFWQGGSAPEVVRSIHGETVKLYGEGLYAYDTAFQAPINRGADLVTLVLGIPLLAFSILLYRRGSLRGTLLLAAFLTYFVYVYASLAFGAAFNGMFLVYIGAFSASLFALGLTIASLHPQTLLARLSPRAPWRGLGILLLACSGVTLIVWLSSLLPSLLQGQPTEHLDTYTTRMTDVLDLGIITPSCFVAGLLLLRRNVVGYLIAVPLLGILVLIAAGIVVETIFQVSSGVTLTPGEIVGPVSGFVILGAIAVWFLVRVLQSVPDAPRSREQ